MGRALVCAACGVSAAFGLFFIFVWAPHPWGWAGFDLYHDLGRALARGDGFPTIDWPWGYAFFLAPFYRAFGDRPWIPLVVQAALNAAVPLLVYLFARHEFDERIAVVAAVLTGLFSFNTVYASTQSSDAVCTVLFVTAVVVFARARRGGDWRLHALAGVLLGLASQFRPNLVLVPAVLGVFLVAERLTLVRATHAVVLAGCSALMLMPWTIRNYRLTGELIPTSTHSGLQLWYGTLQSGPYLKSRAYNPRRVFELGTFPYTSLDRVPLVVSARLEPCATLRPQSLALVYWTDRSPGPTRLAVNSPEPGALRADIPPSPAPTTYYFLFDVASDAGASDPYVYFVSTDHLGDLDRHGDLLDVFDIVRLLRHLAWKEPVPQLPSLDLDGDGKLTDTDVGLAVEDILSSSGRPHEAGPPRIDAGATRVSLQLADRSTLTVPRAWSGRVTDLEVAGVLTERLLHSSVSFAALRRMANTPVERCRPIGEVTVNAPYYREQPHAMRRYLALAYDNIRRDPAAYLSGVAYRSVRVFFIEGTDDRQTAQQFSGSGRVYRVANAASISLFVLFVIGVWAAWRRGCAVMMPLVLIAYIPATLAFVLTNMRYSLSVQPLLYVFVAAALVTALEHFGVWRRSARTELESAPRHASTETAHPL
jgi:hypothetical protein